MEQIRCVFLPSNLLYDSTLLYLSVQFLRNIVLTAYIFALKKMQMDYFDDVIKCHALACYSSKYGCKNSS